MRKERAQMPCIDGARNKSDFDVEVVKSPRRWIAERRIRLGEAKYAVVIAKGPGWLFRRTWRSLGAIETQLEKRGNLICICR